MTDERHRNEMPPDTEMRQHFIGVMSKLPSSPTMTILVVIANVAVFVAMVASGMNFMNPNPQVLIEWGADFGPLTLNGQWWRMISSMFLHFGIVHVGMNMFVLWGLGRLTERFVGSTGFAIAYMISGVAGSIASLAWNPEAISAGASGAVFGVAGTLLGFVVLRRDTMPAGIRGQMLKSMAKFLMLNTVVGFSVARIDMAAHLGGFFGGVICGLLLSLPFSPGMLVKRKFRNLATLMAASVLLPAGMTALPSAPPDIEAEMQQLGKTEEAVYVLFNATQNLAADGMIDDEEFADRIQHQILPLWTTYHKDVKALSQLEYAGKDYFSRLLAYIQLREKSWQMLIEGLREQDNIKLRYSNDLSAEAEKRLSTKQ